MKKKQSIVYIVFFMLAIFQSYAQQDPMYSQYMFNMLAINPAYAGNREVLSMTALGRWQWVGIEGAPQTQTFSVDMPIQNKNIGIGLQLINDKLGVSKNTGFYGSYAYRIRLSNKALLSLGLQGGFSWFRSDYIALGLDNDDAFARNVSRLLPNVGFGGFYNTDKFYVGLSIPHLLKNKLDDFIRNDASNNRAVQYRHLFLSAGVVIPLNENVKLKPSALLKMVKGSPLQFDINANFWLKDVIALGASYRTGDAGLLMFEAQVSKQFRFGYAYDITLSKLNYASSGSHEVMIRYEFGSEKKKILSPRYF